MKKVVIILGIVVLVGGGCNRTIQNKTEETYKENEISSDSVISQIPFIDIDTVKDNSQKNTVWICEDAGTVIFRKFKPDTLIMDFDYTSFDIEESYKVNGLKLLFGYYKPVNGKISPYDTDTDYGKRLVCFNEKNQMVFKSRGEQDSWVFRPVFFVSDDKQHIVILCQLGCEEYWGATAFIMEKSKIYNIGFLDIEPYSEEDYDLSAPVTSVTNIKRINNTLEFTFNEESIKDTKYIYENGILTKVKK